MLASKPQKMAGYQTGRWVPSLCFVFLFLRLFSPRSMAAGATPFSSIKAVNLGGWLVTEGWIKPSLFDGIINKDLLDGTQVQFKSVTTGKYLSAENGGGSVIVANRPAASGWETFKLWRGIDQRGVDPRHFGFRTFFKQFIGLDGTGTGARAVAVAPKPREWETFEIIRSTNDNKRVRIKAFNGLFLQANTESSVTANSGNGGSWGDDDPSVFEMKIVSTMNGEYQVTNGYGPNTAPDVMRKHWQSFIVEDDFRFMKEKGLDAVRIPVGWWIASGPNPPAPFVGGSLEVLDNAFKWAGKYDLKVIVDLHAARRSQNGDEHSGTRDGTGTWGATDESIRETAAVIDFLANRYARDPSLLAVELLNEPREEVVSLERLKQYYQEGYAAVRKYTADAYVIMSTRLSADARELVDFAGGFQRCALDIHYYNLFDGSFDQLTAQQNIDYIYNVRGKELGAITKPDGPLIFVGEWVAEWKVPQATKVDYQRFAKAQLDVYGRATFGWAYWTFRIMNGRTVNHWSLEWMINNGYINLLAA